MLRRPPRSTLFPSTPLARPPLAGCHRLAAPPLQVQEPDDEDEDAPDDAEHGCGPRRGAEERGGDDVLDLRGAQDRKSTRLNSSHANISYAVFCLKKKNYHNS